MSRVSVVPSHTFINLLPLPLDITTGVDSGHQAIAVQASVARTMNGGCDTAAQEKNDARKIDPEEQSHNRSKDSIECVKAGKRAQVPLKDILAHFKKQGSQQSGNPDLAEARGPARSELIEHQEAVEENGRWKNRGQEADDQIKV